MLVPKLLLTPIKIRIFGPKTAKFGPKYAFLVILGQILPFLHILSNARPKNNVNKVPRWVFRYVGNKAYDFSSKKRIFCSKMTKFSPKLAFLSIAGEISSEIDRSSLCDIEKSSFKCFEIGLKLILPTQVHTQRITKTLLVHLPDL